MCVHVSALLAAASRFYPLPVRVPHVFLDAREPAAIVRLRRLVRNVLTRHQRHAQQMQVFHRVCKAIRSASKVAVDSSEGLAGVVKAAASVTGESGSLRPSREIPLERSYLALRRQRPVRVLVVGVPNVGKSKVANGLLGRVSSRSYRWPGVTRTVNVSPDKYLWFREDLRFVVSKNTVATPNERLVACPV